MAKGRPKKGVIPFDEYRLVADEYVMGRTYRQLANDYGVSTAEVRRVLRELNVPIRPRGRAAQKALVVKEINVDTQSYGGSE